MQLQVHTSTHHCHDLIKTFQTTSEEEMWRYVKLEKTAKTPLKINRHLDEGGNGALMLSSPGVSILQIPHWDHVQ